MRLPNVGIQTTSLLVQQMGEPHEPDHHLPMFLWAEGRMVREMLDILIFLPFALYSYLCGALYTLILLRDATIRRETLALRGYVDDSVLVRRAARTAQLDWRPSN